MIKYGEYETTEMPTRNDFKDISGQVFSRLTVVKYAGRKNQQAYWTCKCECGSVCDIQGRYLRDGRSKSCGCFQSEVTAKRSTIHGFSKRGQMAAICRIHRGMMDRCYNPKNNQFHNYGERGITVCDRWKNSVSNFISDMGHPEPGMSIDRINNSIGYCPENCKWSTEEEQQNNRRNNHIMTVLGVKLTAKQASKKYNIPYRRLMSRLQRGLSDHASVFIKTK